MEQMNSSTRIGGIDVGKLRLDAAIEGIDQQLVTGNDSDGIAELTGWLRRYEVARVGVEATGGLERRLRLTLEAEGIEVVVHQPIEVALYGRLTRRYAKTDAGDARLIAAATAAIRRPVKRADPDLMALSEHLTAYERIADQLMTTRTFRQTLSLPGLIDMVDRQIEQLRSLKAALARQLIAAIKACAALRARYELLTSLPGIGPIVAASLVVCMPELGSMHKGQAASLVGVAPHARDSGQHKGQRFIAGGRSRPRRMLYLAALAARRCNPHLNRFADRLKAAGKPPKLIIVALMRKLIEAANLVLKRASPWTA
jgi:transposase